MREVILVVDDEPFVLRTVSSILAHGHYRVLQAASPREALRIAISYGEEIDLLLCDVVMPLLSGPSLADQIVELHPETRCMFMAGMPDSAEVRERILKAGKNFLA